MFEKFSQSWALVKASAGVLKSDKELLVFPALSAICSIIVAASFFVPSMLGGLFQHARENRPVLFLVIFAFYVVQYFVIIFFNSALVGAALIRLRGGDPTVADGFRIASSKIGSILTYALIAATVGMVLRALRERAGWIGQWIVSLLGAAWTVATFLVVPVLVNHDLGPIDAIKKSVELLKKTWGENIIGNAGIGVIFGLLMVLVILGGVALVAGAVASHSPAMIGVAVAIAVIAVMILALVQAALQGIYAAALYRYAEEGQIGGQFDQAMVAGAFKVKA